MEYSIKELMACRLSRDLADGEEIGVGANFPIARAAVLLAYYLHGPNIKLSMGTFRVNLETVDQVINLNFLNDFQPVRWAESAFYLPIDIFNFHKMDVFFVSGIQIDAYGNTNLIGIRDGNNGYKFRGPGSIGTTTLSAVARRYYIVAEHHTPRIFVEKCDFVSAMGYGNGKADLRKELNLPGAGPDYCITPLGVFDFSPNTRRMRLHSLHPGVALNQVVANTGFALEIPEKPEKTPEPSAEELKTLRLRVDTAGELR